MNILEYKNIFENEESHFYYVGINKEILMLIEKYLNNYKIKYPIKILDAGCGTGFLAQKMKKFGKVYGVDIEPNALEFAKERKIKILQSSINKLPFKNDTFDLIISIDVLYHQKVAENKALSEFYRVLKPNGILILKLPAFKFLKGKHDLFVHTKRRYTKKSIEFILKRNNFQVINSTYLASFLFFPALIKRSVERWSGLDNIKIKSDLKGTSKIFNTILILLFNMENFIIKYTNLPFGLSIFSISIKFKV